MLTELKPGTRISHDKYGVGVISRNNLTTYDVIFIRGGEIQFNKARFEAQILEQPDSTANTQEGINLDAFAKILDFALERHGLLQEEVPLGEKWTGGTMILKPKNPELKPKEVPIEVFFHKIVMLRDRLRVLEQNINAHALLSDEDKVNLQQYITRIYGTLTTFNLLFEEKDHYFVGEKTK